MDSGSGEDSIVRPIEQKIQTPWDYLVLTASNAEQASAYRNQLKIRQDLGFLTGIKKILVIPDPGGKRVGSAGSTICCLIEILALELADSTPETNRGSQELWEEALARLRILIIHAGGDSKRLPAYGACGKAFIPLPEEPASFPGSTIFDRQLPVYLDLPEMAPGRGQIVVTTGDVLLDFDATEVEFVETGITGLGCLASPELTRGHGVFVSAKDGAVRLFLQKPSVEEQKKSGAINESGLSLLDIGILNFDALSAVKLLSLPGVRWDTKDGFSWSGPIAAVIEDFGLDLYREVCCAMGSDMELSQYVAAMEKSGIPISKSSLEHIFNAVSDIRFSVRILSKCDFMHFGTIHQVLESGLKLWQKDRGALPPQSILSVNSILANDELIQAHKTWIEGCSINSPIDLAGENALVGVDIDESIALPERACVDVLKGRSSTGDAPSFIRVYAINDRIKDPVPSGATICGLPVKEWLAGMETHEREVWDKELSIEERSLWNARIFPAVEDPRDFREWLWMFDPQKATETQKQAWHNRERYSFEDMACLADQEEFYSRRFVHRSSSILQSVRKLFQSDSEFSARELSYLCSQMDESQCVELCVSLLKIAHEFYSDEANRSGLERLELSRMLHTFATAIRISGEDHSIPWEKILDVVKSRLKKPLKSWLHSFGIDVSQKSNPTEWLSKIQDLAFLNLSQSIVTSRKSGGSTPRNTLRRDEIIWGRAPARLDLGGGWTDTPPYALERGGRVINAAVNLNGQPPIQVYARLIETPEISITSIDHGKRIIVSELEELSDYRKPTSEFALAKAALVLSGLAPGRAQWPKDAKTLQDILQLFGGGIELTTLAAIPSGSGLGTSSIMGAVLLSVIHRMMGRELSHRELFHDVLQLEQELTTGGGWQDQVGGTVKGLKLIETSPGMVPDPLIHPVPPDLLDPNYNEGQTLLYYTGMRRLAKNILRNVVCNYLDRDRGAMNTLQKLHTHPTLIREILLNKDMKAFGETIDLAWRLNKEIDPDSSNQAIEEILTIFEPSMYGAKLLGAGGGGFLLIICKSPEDAIKARRLLEENPPNPLARFFEYDISNSGLEVTVC
jgi:fucokinase